MKIAGLFVCTTKGHQQNLARFTAHQVEMIKFVLSILLVASMAGPAHAKIKSCGKASWYQLTSMTASGERANPNVMAAAHRTLPFGTRVRVTNFRNGRSVVVRINDRGPFIKGRIIDVTRIAAERLGFKGAGWAPVGLSPVGERFATGKSCVTRSAYTLPKGAKVPKPLKRPANKIDLPL